MKPVFFLWIPRTGGTSLHNAIMRLHPIRHIGASWTQQPQLPDVNLNDSSDYYVGHWPASIIDRLPDQTYTVTLLRDPVERVISHYHYIHQYGYHYDPVFTEWAKDASFRDWLDSPYARYAANNLQTRFLCDRKTDDLDWALASLARLNMVGTTETIFQTLQAVCDWWELAPPAIGHENAVTHSLFISNDLRAELYERNQHDLVIYEEAVCANHRNRARA